MNKISLDDPLFEVSAIKVRWRPYPSYHGCL